MTAPRLRVVPETVDTQNLGALVWYTIQLAATATRDELRDAVRTAGLPEALLPKPIPVSDALRRAVKDLGTIPDEKNDRDEVVRLLIREAPTVDKDHLTYRLVRETGEAGRKNLAYRELASIDLDKRTGSLVVTHLALELTPGEDAVLDKLGAQYRFDREHYDSEMVRHIARGALKGTDPITVRPSGGIYFIGQAHLSRVEQVRTFLRQFTVGTRLYSVPVLNEVDNRTMVSDHVEEQVKVESVRVVEDLKKLLQAERRSEVQVQGALRSLRGLAEMTERYEDLLQTRIDGARAVLGAAQTQARALLDRLVSGDSQG